MKIQFLLGAALCAATASAAAAAPAAIPGVKNIIVIINDGGGNTVYEALRKYNGAPLVTDGAGFRRIQTSTHPLRIDSTDPGSLVQDSSIVYSSARFWDVTPVAGNSVISGYTAYPAGFRGYEYSRLAHPDSGNTATSLASGIKTYNNAINVDGAGNAQVAITDVIAAAVKVGKAAGVVSTVQFGDATPAALGGAHNTERSNRQAITEEMFSSGKLTVIAGTANPDFNNDGMPRTPVYAPTGYFPSNLWLDLKNNTNTSGFNGQKWKLLQERADIEAIANKTVKPPKKLAMIIRGDSSHQYNRAGNNVNPTLHAVYDPASLLPNCVTNGVPVAAGVACQQPPKTNVPSLASMTIAGLNTLAATGRGIYLMAEAGGVDRAEHGNSTGRMIEDMAESNATVQAVIDWVNRKDTAATWDNTLLIVTADHDHLLFGPDAATVPYQDLVDNGPGVVPGNRWFGPNHGTGLVPLYAYGRGAAQIEALATLVDSFTGSDGVTRGYGLYTDQSTIGQALKLTAANK